ncbi:sigma-54 dependent transcriptional regulator [soil metagenome]
MTKSNPAVRSVSGSGHPVRDRTAQSVSNAILLIDDNPQVAEAVVVAFECAGHRVDTAADPQDAFSLLARHRYDAILLDLNFRRGETSGAEGFACLARIMAEDPAAVVVVITAHSGIRIAVAAMQAGALDFVIKPWRNADLIGRVETAITKRRRLAANTAAELPTTATSPCLHRLLGDSPAIEGVRDLIRRIAPTSVGVIVSGPSGAGRSLVAALLHEGSPHVDTAATTVDVRDPAAWERIDQASGTLVLRHPDRLDEMTQSLLVDRLPATVRPIAIVEDADLLSSRLRGRVGTIELALPPLALRGDDALILARHFATVAAAQYGKPVPPFTASAEALILARCWTDEVRGLARMIERAVLLDDDGVIDSAVLLPQLELVAAVAQEKTGAARDLSLDETERALIGAALEQHRHNISRAAAALGLSRQALYRRMTRHGL